MCSFIDKSPYRKYFRFVLMPTVDARPQAREWISMYQSTDACLTYSDWAGKVIMDQSGGKINYIGSSPPSAHPAYRPIKDKLQLKLSFGLDPDCNIIGTVMRNQRRKLYPDLFSAFKTFLSKVDDPRKYFLYCHTSYPDLGWDIPELIQEYQLSSHVLLTYICNDTQKPFPSLFRGAITQSPFSGKFSATISNVKNGLSYDDLAKIINLFDLYVQYANCEGFGLPQVEAAACGIPVAGTDYSAMESVLRQLEGIPITPKALYKELETGCLRAVPDNELAANIFKDFFDKDKTTREKMGLNTRQKFLEHFQWNKSGKVWEDYFDSQDIIPEAMSWKSPPNIRYPALKPKNLPENTKHEELAKWLISEVLCEPEKLGSFMESRLIRDLLYKTTTAVVGGMYHDEHSNMFDDNKTAKYPFDFDIAYSHMENLCHRRNYWEHRRVNTIL